MDIKKISDTEISLNGQPLNAQQVEDLINQLAILRSQLQPSVPMRLDNWEQKVIPQPDPQIEIGQGDDGRIRIALRHAGTGWHVFGLNLRSAAFVRDVLIKRCAGEPVRLVNEKATDGNRMH